MRFYEKEGTATERK